MMKHKLYLRSLLFIILLCVSFVNVNAQDLEKHRWENRILIIKTVDSSSAIYQEQVKEFSNSAEEMADRKFILYKIIKEDFELINFANPELSESGKILGKPVGKALTDQDNFEVILIGLDGGIKLQQAELLRKKALFNIVDAMPMRRSELKRKNE